MVRSCRLSMRWSETSSCVPPQDTQKRALVKLVRQGERLKP